jgi:nucleotide-binding universal stress UspA family protein
MTADLGADMQHFDSSPLSVVVGIDGSRSAIVAALWAVDEAVSRDMPLRLVYAIEPSDNARLDAHVAVEELEAAERAVRQAVTAVESTQKPVKIEVEILQGRSPRRALKVASRSAAMICVGSMGLKRATQGRVGSTAVALAASAHCPVAVIRASDPRPAQPGWIVAELEGSFASNGVLQGGLDEARLRGAPLRVLTSWQSRYTDIHDPHAVGDGNRLAKAELDRRLGVSRRRYPALDIRPVVVHGNTLTYLARNAASIQLVVVGRERTRGVTDLVGPLGHAALHDTNCSVLICESQNVL